MKHTVMSIGALLATAAVCSALSITPSSSFLINTGTDGINPDSSNPDNPEGALLAVYGGSILYKSNVEGGEETEPFVNSYETSYSDTLSNPSSATISLNGGGPAISGYSPLYLLVKDGNALPYWYFYNLTTAGWNGTESLKLSGFWPQQGAISHVTITGTPSTNRVPDGGTTLATLGFSLVGLGAMRRLMTSKS